MSRFGAPDYWALLAISCLTLSACQPVGNPSGATASRDAQESDRPSSVAAEEWEPTGNLRALAVAEKAEIYAFAAAIETDQIAASIDEARREPDPDRREVLIHALTERLAEVDPLQAIDLVVSLEQDFELELLAPLFTTVARDDPDTAIDALAKLSVRQQFDVFYPLAMTVLEEIGGDAGLIDAWLRAIPSSNSLYGWVEQREDVFQLAHHGLAALASIDSDLLMDRLEAMSDDEWMQSGLLYSTARALATTDVHEVLARIENMRDEERRAPLRYQLLNSWAASEPMDALNYLASVDSWNDVEDGERDQLLRSVAENALSQGIDPGRLVALARQMLLDPNGQVLQVALEALAKQDPVAASAWLQEIPAHRRISATADIASRYAQLDPTRAFLWSQQESPEAERYVLGAIAMTNPDLALDLALGGSARSPASAVSMIVVYAIQGNPEDAPQLAPRLAQRLAHSLEGTALYDSAISSLAGAWMQMDPEGGMAWLAAPGVELPTTAYQAAARNLRNDPSQAAAMVSRIPAEARPLWIEEIASNFVRTNPEGAIAWLEQHRSDPDYALATVSAIEGIVQYDPPRAADLFAALPAMADRQRVAAAADTLATTWTNSDPRAAMSWASSLSDDGLRRRALMNVTVAWSGRDPDSARAWILRQPTGPDRDGALQSYVTATTRIGLPRADVLDKFSTEEALRRAVTNVLGNSPNLEPAAARAWLDEIDLSPPLRQQVEATIAQIELIREQNPEMRDSLLLLPPVP